MIIHFSFPPIAEFMLINSSNENKRVQDSIIDQSLQFRW